MNIQKISLFLICLLCFITSHSQPKANDCEILKHCKLKYIDGQDSTCYIIINNTEHVEYYESNKYYIKSKLNWLNDCEYEATIIEISLPNFPFGPGPGEVMHVSFKKIDDKIVSYVATVRGQNVEEKFEIIN